MMKVLLLMIVSGVISPVMVRPKHASISDLPPTRRASCRRKCSGNRLHHFPSPTAGRSVSGHKTGASAAPPSSNAKSTRPLKPERVCVRKFLESWFYARISVLALLAPIDCRQTTTPIVALESCELRGADVVPAERVSLSRRGSSPSLCWAALLALPLWAQGPQLGPAPRVERQPSASPRLSAPAAVVPGGIDTRSREAVIQPYQTSYQPLQNFTISFTGDVAAGKAGDTSADYKNAVISLVNFFRSMAGVPPIITLDLDLSQTAQLAASMLDANEQLSH